MANLKVRTSRNPAETRRKLIEAAGAEFGERGYAETNTNEIARRAGFAPQTFYRHFKDKIAIFLAYYEHWVAEEIEALAPARTADDAADILISHHTQCRLYRRALRVLSVTDDEVRRVRTESRKRQIDWISSVSETFRSIGLSGQSTALLCVERIADACAEGELHDLGVSEDNTKEQLAELLSHYFGLPRSGSDAVR